MDWVAEFCQEQNYVKVVLEGDFDPTDHFQMMEDVLSREYWKPGMHILIDSSLVNYANATSEVMRQASDNMSIFRSSVGSGKAAVLMATMANFGKGRQFETLAEGKSQANIRVFGDEISAIRWITDGMS